MKRKNPLTIEELENRLTPAAFGFPWPNGAYLTVSFVPDGTAIGATATTPNGTSLGSTATSDLFATLGTKNASAWEYQFLRAFQTWAAAADVNFGVVNDHGAPLGTNGALQGDPYFGDIRIGATSLGPDLVATTVPFDPSAGTWSGDILLNSDDFGPNSQVNYDLYSVALHEIGHALGLGNNDNPASVMFPNYIGVRTGLSGSDVEAVRDLYGARDNSANWWQNDGGWFWSADFRSAALENYKDQLAGQDGWQAAEPLSLDSSIDNPWDANFSFYQTTSSNPNFTVDLETSGRSLLEARLTVYDLYGHVVSTAAATDPLNGNLSVTVTGKPNGLYFFKVEGAAPDVFGVGAYRLKVVPANPAALSAFTAIQQEFAADAARDADNSLATATVLQRTYRTTNDHYDYLVSGQLVAAGNVDYYSLRAPRARDGAAQSMTITVWGQEPDGLSPVVSVFDAQGNPVSATVVAQTSSDTVLRVDGAKSGAVYYVKVAGQSSGTGATGAYSLGIDFSTRALPLDSAATVQPLPSTAITTPGIVESFNQFTLNDATLLHFDFSVQDLTDVGPTEGQVTIFDKNGNIVYQNIIQSGQSTSVNLFLPAGTYTLGFAGASKSGVVPTGMTFQVGARMLNGQVGPILVDPDEPPPLPTFWNWLPASLAQLFDLQDPYGVPITGGGS